LNLQSNGRKFSDLNFTKSVSNYIDSFEIALHGSNNLVHDRITQTSGSFSETIRGISNLVKLNSKVVGKIVLSKYNYTDLKNTLKLFRSLGVSFVIVAFPHSSGDPDYMKKIAPRYFEIKKYVEDSILYFENDSDFFVTFESVMPCALDGEYNISSFFDFFEDLNLRSMKLVDKSSKNWNLLLKEIKMKNKICFDCIYNNYCNGYWREYIEEFGFNEFIAKTIVYDNEKVFDLSKCK